MLFLLPSWLWSLLCVVCQCKASPSCCVATYAYNSETETTTQSLPSSYPRVARVLEWNRSTFGNSGFGSRPAHLEK